MLVRCENMGNVRNRLHLIANQGIWPSFLAGYRGAEAAENDGTHLQRRFAQVRDLGLHFKGAHPPGLVLAHDEFQVIAARSEDRSEERRVGKECRSRWSPYH